jgi:NAD(P)-dependent dehydrogenase (short-subunit alcohol dehydrogenase family)
MQQRLAGKTALITGAGNGIGRAIAQRFASEGAHVVSMDTDAAGNDGTASLIRDAGGSCETVCGDVSSAADVERAFLVAGAVDVLVNNAAFWGGDGILHQVSETDWDRVLAVCLKSVFLCTRQALAGMMERRAGSIINISSVNAMSGMDLAAYTAAKGGIVSLTRLLAQQYGHYGIRFNAICPGTILSESSKQFYQEHPDVEAELRAFYPAGKFGTPADIAAAALFLASEEAEFINGSAMVVDGAMSAVHRLPSLIA